MNSITQTPTLSLFYVQSECEPRLHQDKVKKTRRCCYHTCFVSFADGTHHDVRLSSGKISAILKKYPDDNMFCLDPSHFALSDSNTQRPLEKIYRKLNELREGKINHDIIGYDDVFARINGEPVQL